MTADDIDPRAIGAALREAKRQRIPFEAAWLMAAGRRPTREQYPNKAVLHDMRDLYRFMEKHFRAAYLNDATTNGRFVAEREQGRGPKPRVPVASVPNVRGVGAVVVEARGRMVA